MRIWARRWIGSVTATRLRLVQDTSINSISSREKIKSWLRMTVQSDKGRAKGNVGPAHFIEIESAPHGLGDWHDPVAVWAVRLHFFTYWSGRVAVILRLWALLLRSSSFSNDFNSSRWNESCINEEKNFHLNMGHGFLYWSTAWYT